MALPAPSTRAQWTSALGEILPALAPRKGAVVDENLDDQGDGLMIQFSLCRGIEEINLVPKSDELRFGFSLKTINIHFPTQQYPNQSSNFELQ